MVVKPGYFNEPTYRSPRKTLLALRDHMSFYRINKLGTPQLSSSSNKFDWIEVQKPIHETLRNSNLDLTVFTPKTTLEHTTSGDRNAATDLQKAQTTDTGNNQVLTWVRKQPRPPRSTYRVYLVM